VLYLDALGSAGSTLGCDFVGRVEHASGRFKVGDQVVGLIHGGAYKGVGSAAEYAVIDEKLCWGVPKGMEPKEAVTFGTAFITAALVSPLGLGIAELMGRVCTSTMESLSLPLR
jgi:NADPH:quinone reductase-like Zn-dependent oxidoreductase